MKVREDKKLGGNLCIRQKYDTDKALQAIEAYRLRKEYDYDRVYMGSKNITPVFKRVWILLKACLNALIMKGKDWR